MKKKLKIREIDLSDPKQRAEFERIRKEVSKQTQPMADAIRDSQRITSDDLKIVINAK